jgi:hypothetical protein
MNEPNECTELCLRHGLEVIAIRPGVFGGSRYIAHVRDASGRSLILKQTTPERGSIEIAALRAWRGNDAAVQLIEEFEGGAYVAEFVEGTVVAEIPSASPVDYAAIGKMLRALHGATAPAGLPDVRSRFTARAMEEWSELPPEMVGLAQTAAARLRAYTPAQPVLLHGDVVPANIILGADGPRAIDPLPCAGLAAWDVAQFAVAAAGRGRRDCMRPLLEGYGDAMPHLADMFAWMHLFFLRNNLAAGRQEFVQNLRPLAEELIRDPQGFSRRHGVG